MAAIEGLDRGWGLAGREMFEVGEGEEAGVMVFEGANGADAIGATGCGIGAEAEVVAGDNLGDEAVAVGAVVEVEGLGDLKELLGFLVEESCEVGEGGHRSTGADGRFNVADMYPIDGGTDGIRRVSRNDLAQPGHHVLTQLRANR